MNISNQVSSSTKFLLLCYVMAVVLFPILSALLVLVLQMSTISIERSSIGTSSQVYWWQKVSTINPWWTGYCTFVMASVAWLEYPIWFWMVGGSFTCQLRGKQIAVRGIFWGEIPVHINQKCNQTNRYLPMYKRSPQAINIISIMNLENICLFSSLGKFINSSWAHLAKMF